MSNIITKGGGGVGGLAVVNNNKVLFGEALLGGPTLNLFIKPILIESSPFL